MTSLLLIPTRFSFHPGTVVLAVVGLLIAAIIILVIVEHNR